LSAAGLAGDGVAHVLGVAVLALRFEDSDHELSAFAPTAWTSVSGTPLGGRGRRSSSGPLPQQENLLHAVNPPPTEMPPSRAAMAGCAPTKTQHDPRHAPT
jgi:hypothetical protein